MAQPSENLDDTGYFSVQVIMKALSLWSLELVPLFSSDEYAQQIQPDPSKAAAFVLHMENHWFCVRRFAVEDDSADSVAFFNLNSLLGKPEYMSSLYLAEYLRQMQTEGYSIFVVKGSLPECPADQSPPRMIPKPLNALVDLTKSPSTSSASETDWELQKVIELSLQASNKPAHDDSLDSDLERAMRLSMECFKQSSGHSTPN